MKELEELDKEVEQIRTNNVMGADFLSNWAIELIKKYILIKKEIPKQKFYNELKDFSIKLINTRPSMAPFFSKISYFLYEINELGKKDINFTEFLIGITSIHKNMKKIDDAAQNKINKIILDKVPDNSVVLTHSYSSITTNALKYLVKNRKNIEFIVTESRPINEGRLVVKELINYAPITYILDSAIGYCMKQKKVNFILLGADTVTIDGDLINKVGTYPLAVLARDLKSPIYSLCNKWKFNVREFVDKKIIIESRPSSEVWTPNLKESKNLTIKNYYFDITPGNLITSYITGSGEIQPEKIKEIIHDKFPVEWIKDNFKF
ncbi:MAG: hypothetical protein EAX96_08285 [Candidatus Lokiarchaeota archaeon]|nr:hypothetical protein [Candidatus Lokiarchaeota archaeon]